MRRKLVLFDVDGTLISDGGAARAGFHEALRRVYQFEPMLDSYDFSGRTDPQIARMVLKDAGFSEDTIAAGIEELWKEYLGELQRRADGNHVRPLPGVTELLERLSRCEWITLALLTGNIEPGARAKLAPADLNRFFPFGAFGSDSMHREDLPPIAVARAFALENHRYTEGDVVLIGDSIFDIRCGVPHHATTIAVATGRTPTATLRDEHPDHLFEDLDDIDGLLEAIRGVKSTEKREDSRQNVHRDAGLINE